MNAFAHVTLDYLFGLAIDNDRADILTWLRSKDECKTVKITRHMFYAACNRERFKAMQWLIKDGYREDMTYVMYCLCRLGWLPAAKILYTTCVACNTNMNIHSAGDAMFRETCNMGHKAVARWLLSLDRDWTKWDSLPEMDSLMTWSCRRNAWMQANWV